MAYSFTTSGAVPKPTSVVPSPVTGSSPISKALSSAVGDIKNTMPNLSSFNYSPKPVSSQPNMSSAPNMSVGAPAMAPTPGLLSSQYKTPAGPQQQVPKADTPLKKTTTTNTDGSSTTHEYHAPAVNTASSVGQGSTQKDPSKDAPVYTPSGVKVDGNLSTWAGNKPQNQNTTTFPGLIGNLANQGNSTYNQQATQASQGLIDMGAKPGADYLNKQTEAEKYNEALKQSRINEAQGLAANASNPIPLEFQQGRGQVLQSQYAQEQAALGSAYQGASNLVGAANTQQGLQQSGLQSGGGLALQGQGQAQSALGTAAGLVAPQLAGYNQQAFNPATNQFSGGGSLSDAVNSAVQKLQNGQMTYNDALTSLAGYGQGGIDALQKSLPPGFNIAQSNTLSGQQGSINATYQLADTAISNLENSVKKLGTLQGTNIPGVNAVGNAISNITGAGSQETREYTQAIQSARGAYAALIASIKGGTPTDYSSQALAEIPDNPTPNDIAALRHSFEVLGQARKDIFGNPGTSASGGNVGGQTVQTSAGSINTDW